ncbi:MAG: DUF192 domain-containing protein [Bacteriovoracaceae bacterium]
MSFSILHNGKIILKNVVVADDFWSRLTGYMFRNDPHVPGILFVASGSMQTTFMKFNLDIVFLNKEDVVVKILKNVKPWRITKFYPKVSRVLEVPAGVLPSNLNEGDILKIV